MLALPRKSHVFSLILAFAGVLLPAALDGSAHAEPAPRYPFDPLCPWGRLADGHGMILRCLQAEEANALAAHAAAASVPSAGEPSPPPNPGVANGVAPSVALPGAPAPSAAAPSAPPSNVAPEVPPSEPSRIAPPPPKPAAAPPSDNSAPRVKAPSPARGVNASQIGPLAVDTGDLPTALSELRKPKQRYADCVSQNGGLLAPSARVQIRFLVRELGRAEGVSVKEHKGISLLAAKCIAGVIDRRNVGYPEAPIVGATLTIDLEPLRGE
jgi:hypothetical protein